MFVFVLVLFVLIWGWMFFYQFRSEEKYDGNLDIKDYVFCSNVLVEWPRCIVCILFFNSKLLKIPITVVLGQVANYIFLIYYTVRRFVLGLGFGEDYSMTYFKVWFWVFVAILLLICVDFEVFYQRNKWKRF